MDDHLSTLGVIGLGLAHELSSPLTATALSLELLIERVEMGEDVEPARLVTELRGALERVRRMGQLVARLRALATDGVALNLPFDPAAAARQAIRLAETAGAAAALRLSVEAPRELVADRLLVEQALLCLILNAAEASAAVTLRVGDRAFHVEDDGPGFADPAQAVALGRSDKALTSRSGMGVGLSLVQTLAQRLGAALVLENRDEGGARASLVWV